MSHQAPRITTPPSISLSLPPSTSTQLSITLLCLSLHIPMSHSFKITHHHAHDASGRFFPYTLLEIRAQFPPQSDTLPLIFPHLAVALSLCYTPPPPCHLPSSLDLSLPSLSPLLTSPRPPVNLRVIKFATVAGVSGGKTEGDTMRMKEKERSYGWGVHERRKGAHIVRSGRRRRATEQQRRREQQKRL